MKRIKYLLQKEFLQIFRNKGMLPIIFVMPVVQLVVLSFAATYELNEVDYYLIDRDHSTVSQQLVDHLEATGYFKQVGQGYSDKQAKAMLRTGEAEMVLNIPADFEHDLVSEQHASVQFEIDAVNGSLAGLIQTYAQSILQQYNKGIRARLIRSAGTKGQSAAITVQQRHWYNPELDYIKFMVPGILVVLVTMIGTFLSGMNIVRERELGTIEQLNVTPIKKYQFIIGKLLPLWIIALFELAFGLAIAHFGFHIMFEGSLLLIFFIAGIYLLAVEGLGLFISTTTDTQQQAMFIAWFLMVVFILMGGLFTPIESMPVWAQHLTLLNPVAYFIEIMRAVLLKGAGLMDVWHSVAALAAMAVVILSFAVSRYHKASA